MTRDAIKCSPLAAVLVKAVIDTGFRKELTKDPEKAIDRADIKLSPDEVYLVKQLRPEEWESLTVEDLNERLSKIKDLDSLLFEGD